MSLSFIKIRKILEIVTVSDFNILTKSYNKTKIAFYNKLKSEFGYKFCNNPWIFKKFLLFSLIL